MVFDVKLTQLYRQCRAVLVHFRLMCGVCDRITHILNAYYLQFELVFCQQAEDEPVREGHTRRVHDVPNNLNSTPCSMFSEYCLVSVVTIYKWILRTERSSGTDRCEEVQWAETTHYIVETSNLERSTMEIASAYAYCVAMH